MSRFSSLFPSIAILASAGTVTSAEVGPSDAALSTPMDRAWKVPRSRFYLPRFNPSAIT